MWTSCVWTMLLSVSSTNHVIKPSTAVGAIEGIDHDPPLVPGIRFFDHHDKKSYLNQLLFGAQ